MPVHKPLTIRVHLPPALARHLGARRKQTGQTLSAIVVQALERLLGDEDKTIFQTSTVDALMEGASQGDMTMGELKTHGDFGLGTFDGLDGEMIELDGKVFQVRADGHAHPVEDSARTARSAWRSARDSRSRRRDASLAEHFPRASNRRTFRLREDSRHRQAGQ